MSRAWNEFVALLGDLVPGGVSMLAMALFVLTLIVAALWYWWPAWLPSRWRRRHRSGRPSSGATRGKRRRWPRMKRLRLRWRWGWWRRHRRRPDPPVEPALPDDQLPEVPAAVLALNADELAAAGRYAEAVRERLRAMVRELIERGALAYRPGWTVTELTQAAGWVWPAAATPLGAAAEVFSQIWYGLRPATADDDLAMRGYAEQVRAVLDATGVQQSAGGVR
jgi:hypothetical protein